MVDKKEFYPSYIELDKSAYHRNISFLQELIGKAVRFSSVIKGNAYGHGIENFVPMAEECGIRHFSVFSTDEALRAYEARTEDSHIMVMGMVNEDVMEWVVNNGVSFFVFEDARLKIAAKIAKKTGKPARIHLHLETGMNRLGLNREQLEEAVRIIKKHREYLQVDGVCTHYAGSESVGNHVRVKNQIKRFRQLSGWLEKKGIEARYRHTACSAAVLNYPETRMDLVRIGIAQYGYWPSRETYMYFMKHRSEDRKRSEDPLKRVLSWKSVVMSTKKVEAGEFVGYGNIYLTSRDQIIATVPIGYTHGFGRNLTNVGIVLIKGERAPVAGLVNMNMLTVDVTDIPDVSPGDEVVLIGNQGESEMTVSSFSEMSNFLNYEVLARLPEKLPRFVV